MDKINRSPLLHSTRFLLLDIGQIFRLQAWALPIRERWKIIRTEIKERNVDQLRIVEKEIFKIIKRHVEPRNTTKKKAGKTELNRTRVWFALLNGRAHTVSPTRSHTTLRSGRVSTESSALTPGTAARRWTLCLALPPIFKRTRTCDCK